ncbi:hypothetical protein MIT9_P2347 [Methylomarinovum caldicuralii]|uniref:Transposase n=2 Tax=Methylomarinovum caldicuralii TaxID=438856 RepID=A0AAU9CAV7_9GAMM|nr:hypothetical protein MIT9_P2347 [Methylomarinovum caldicuralii]
MVHRKVTYRLYPTPRQIEALDRLRFVHCLLWNTALDELRRAWMQQQKSLSFSAQCKALTGWRLLPGPGMKHGKTVQKHIFRKEEAAKQASGKRKDFPISKRLRKEYALLGRLHEKVAHQRRDFLHQTSAWIVATFAVLGLEQLNIRGMTAKGGAYKRGLNRGILDAAGGMFHQILRYKAEEAGALAMEADPRRLKPSQRCHRCGRLKKKPLSQRWHDCPCGASCSRDENAARVLMVWVMEQVDGREPAGAWREVRPASPLGEPALP